MPSAASRIDGGTALKAARVAMMMVGRVISASTIPPTSGAERGSPNVPSGDRLEAPADDPDRLVILQYTSGSTSEPRGVMVDSRLRVD